MKTSFEKLTNHHFENYHYLKQFKDFETGSPFNCLTKITAIKVSCSARLINLKRRQTQDSRDSGPFRNYQLFLYEKDLSFNLTKISNAFKVIFLLHIVLAASCTLLKWIKKSDLKNLPNRFIKWYSEYYIPICIVFKYIFINLF